MSLKNLVPWRIRHRLDEWMEASLRPAHPSIYKLLKFGRFNLNTPEYWDRVWQTDTLDRNYAELFELILARIPAGATVIDVGAGMGNLARLIRDRRQAKVTCLDFSPWACQQLAEQGFDTVVSILPRIPLPDDFFDIAVATEVLEHLSRPENTLREMARVVRAGGLIMCSVPDDTLHPHEELEHQNAFTEKELEAMLSAISLEYVIVKGRHVADGRHGFLLGCVTVPSVTGNPELPKR